jgi:hypothetical protein
MIIELIHQAINNMQPVKSTQDLIHNNTVIIKLPNINKEEIKQSFKQHNALIYDKDGITTNQLLYGNDKCDILIMDYEYFNLLPKPDMYFKLIERFGSTLKIVVIG